MSPSAELTYRSRAFTTIGWSILVLVGLIVVTLLVAHPAPWWLWVPVTLVGGAAAGWLAFRCYVAPRVVAGEAGVQIVNPFRTTQLRWADIERFEYRPMLTVVRRDGTTVTAWAVPSPSSARLIGRTSQG